MSTRPAPKKSCMVTFRCGMVVQIFQVVGIPWTPADAEDRARDHHRNNCTVCPRGAGR